MKILFKLEEIVPVRGRLANAMGNAFSQNTKRGVTNKQILELLRDDVRRPSDMIKHLYKDSEDAKKLLASLEEHFIGSCEITIQPNASDIGVLSFIVNTLDSEVILVSDMTYAMTHAIMSSCALEPYVGWVFCTEDVEKDSNDPEFLSTLANKLNTPPTDIFPVHSGSLSAACKNWHDCYHSEHTNPLDIYDIISLYSDDN